jgi:CelD/BcsL family acetyltransferase involved in cellulose biosynthesis
MRVQCVNPLALPDGDLAAWRQWLGADPQLSSPYFTPDWAQFVARRRRDVQVAVFRREDGMPLAFLPVQRPNAYAALPVGGPVCDYQALIGPTGLDLSLAARALEVGRIDLTGGIRNNALAPHLLADDVGHVAQFPDGWDAWVAARQAAGSKTVSRARKRLSKLTRESENAKVEIEAFSTDGHAYDELLHWKREQMWRTGVTDIFERPWISELVRDTFEAPAANPNFGGALFVLRVGRKPVAGLFCLRAQKTLHAWFVAHDPKFSDYSPGLILFTEAIKAASSAGYTEMDLGPGDYRFKESFASWGRPIGAGFIGRRTLSSASRAAQFQVRALVEGLPLGRARQWPAKAMRRLDISRGLSAPAGKAA